MPKLSELTNKEPEKDCKTRHMARVSDNLVRTLNEKVPANDITFIVEGEEMYASSFILCAASEYFEGYLLGKFKEAAPGPKQLPIEGVSKANFSVCLYFLYTGEADLNADNLLGVLRAADMLNIGLLIFACCETASKLAKAKDGPAFCMRHFGGFNDLPARDPDGPLAAVVREMLQVVQSNLADIVVDKFDEEALARTFEDLSLSSMLKLCASIGLSLKKVKSPAECLRRLMPAVSWWCRVHFKHGDDLSPGFAADLRAVLGIPLDQLMESGLGAEHEDVAKVTQAQLKKNGNSAGSGIGRGVLEYIKHSALPALPEGAGELKDDDIRVELPIKTKVALNPLASLFDAYAFFHPDMWSALDDRENDVRLCELLRLSSLPVESEDLVLARLVELDKSRLEKLLRHVRWSFVTTDLLLQKLRTSKALRGCQVTKEAMKWMFDPTGRAGKPSDVITDRRNAYKKSVKELSVFDRLSSMMDWHLSDATDDVAVHLEDAKTKAREAEQRTASAEARLEEVAAVNPVKLQVVVQAAHDMLAAVEAS